MSPLVSASDSSEDKEKHKSKLPTSNFVSVVVVDTLTEFPSSRPESSSDGAGPGDGGWYTLAIKRKNSTNLSGLEHCSIARTVFYSVPVSGRRIRSQICMTHVYQKPAPEKNVVE